MRRRDLGGLPALRGRDLQLWKLLDGCGDARADGRTTLAWMDEWTDEVKWRRNEDAEEEKNVNGKKENEVWIVFNILLF